MRRMQRPHSLLAVLTEQVAIFTFKELCYHPVLHGGYRQGLLIGYGMQWSVSYNLARNELRLAAQF
jgi:hypothetical protein